MRETSSMVISQHHLERLQGGSEHFDISSDIDKSSIIIKKYNFLETHKNIIDSEKLQKYVNNIHTICEDVYVKKYVFTMFNNDYKRLIACLASFMSL